MKCVITDDAYDDLSSALHDLYFALNDVIGLLADAGLGNLEDIIDEGNQPESSERGQLEQSERKQSVQDL